MSTTLRLGTLLAVVLALITAALPAASARAGDPPKPATIVGVVLTKTDGKLVPVPHAKVAIKRSDNITQETIANAKGEFSFAKVVPGQAVILAHKAEVGRGAERVLLRAGEIQRVRVGIHK